MADGTDATTAVTLATLEFENVRRLRSGVIEFTPGLNVIGGRNRQGKTTAIDLILNLLQGEAYTPHDPVHHGEKKGSGTLTLSNGITVSTTYTENGRTALRVSGIDSSPQQFLYDLFGKRVIDWRTFFHASIKEKSETLLRVTGLDISPYVETHNALYEQRTDITRQERKARGHYEALPYYEQAPPEEVSAQALIKEQQDRLAANAYNAERRMEVSTLSERLEYADGQVLQCDRRIQQLEEQLAEARGDLQRLADGRNALVSALEAKRAEVATLTDLGTDDIEAELAQVEEVNRLVRANAAREQARIEWERLRDERLELTERLECNRQAKLDLLAGADMPLPGLGVDENGEITYNGDHWTDMATSDQYIVAVAVAKSQNPQAPVVIVDGLECMDADTLRDFAAYCEREGAQVIGTRVSTGDEVDWIIEDGRVADVPAKKGLFT